MKVFELKEQLKANSVKELIDFFKSNGYKVSSHMQNLTDEQIDFATNNFAPSVIEEEEAVNVDEVMDVISSKKKTTEEKYVPQKKYEMTDLIPCKSVVPWQVIALGIDKQRTYHWGYFGDIDMVEYRDLQALRRSDYLTRPLIVIDDPELCMQWSRDLGNTYKYFLNVDYPEEFFDLPDVQFETLLRKAPDSIKEVIKVTAIAMVRAENSPTVQKLNLIDNILGTCIKEFI